MSKAPAAASAAVPTMSTMKVIVIAGTQSGVGKARPVGPSATALLVSYRRDRLVHRHACVLTHFHCCLHRTAVLCGPGPHGCATVRLVARRRPCACVHTVHPRHACVRVARSQGSGPACPSVQDWTRRAQLVSLLLFWRPPLTSVSPPDCRDPLLHEAATGRLSYNLDSWLLDQCVWD